MRSALFVLVSLLVAAQSSTAQSRGGTPLSTSAPLASQLVALLQARALDSVAAPDPSQKGRYVAALVFPKVQILAIGARYSVPELLDERLRKSDYRGTYVEINRAADLEGRIFIQDLGANGILAEPEAGGSPDVVYRDGVHSTIFTGDWKALSMPRETYLETFTRADADYATLLRLLIGQLAPSGAPQPSAVRR